MRRDHQWRNNIRNEMRSALADDPDYTAHRVVRRVVHGVPLESLTAAAADRVVFHPVDHDAPIRETVAHFHAALLSHSMTAALADEEEGDCDCDED